MRLRPELVPGVEIIEMLAAFDDPAVLDHGDVVRMAGQLDLLDELGLFPRFLVFSHLGQSPRD